MVDMAKELTGRNTSHDRLRTEEFWALKGVSLELRRGECLGLIGRNGAGKTTLLRMLNGLIKLDHGHIEVRGRVGALIALGPASIRGSRAARTSTSTAQSSASAPGR